MIPMVFYAHKTVFGTAVDKASEQIVITNKQGKKYKYKHVHRHRQTNKNVCTLERVARYGKKNEIKSSVKKKNDLRVAAEREKPMSFFNSL